jgi:hypothetical protein
MKKILVVILAFCATITISQAQQAAANTPEMASTKVTVKKKAPAASKLYLLSNGNETKQITQQDFKKIHKKDIEYVRELTDPVLLSMYGDKATSGVVLVQLKNSPDEKKRRARHDSARKSGI